jgi:hypothetical protein
LTGWQFASKQTQHTKVPETALFSQQSGDRQGQRVYSTDLLPIIGQKAPVSALVLLPALPAVSTAAQKTT